MRLVMKYNPSVSRSQHQEVMADRGFVLLMAIMMASFFMTVTLAIASFSVSHYASARRSLNTLSALSVAEAGAEHAMLNINNDSSYDGSSGEVTFFNDSVKGKGTFETAIENGSISNEKIIYSTGRIYIPANAPQPILTRKVKLTIFGSAPTPYAVQTGPGGLIMSNSATVGNGEVYVNGYLTMSNSSRIGSVATPSKVWVAHVNCPTGGGSSFPTQCTSGQPITISNSAHIYGEVRATNQTNGNGMTNTGLITGSTAPAVALPTYDRQAQISAVTVTRSGSDASCSHSQSKTWAANTHITGNVTLSNSCQVTVQGDVWIDGSLTLSNSSVIRVAAGLTPGPAIMVDGSGGVSLNNSSTVAANSLAAGFKFITFWSAASCSPNCSNVTGQDLYNSRNSNTISIGNSSLAAGSIFYSRWTKVTLSNGGSIGAVIGQTVQLQNSGNISFATQEVIEGEPDVWDVKNYQQVFN